MRQRALTNGHKSHLAAALIRGKSILKVAPNSFNTSPSFYRVYNDGDVGYCQHAEMAALSKAKPGDTILVLRWKKDGSLSCAKPCCFCESMIRKANIKYVYYSNWDGEIVKMKVKNMT